MSTIDDLVEPLDDNESLSEGVAAALKKANSAKSTEQKLKALLEAQYLLLNRAQSGHLLDNFLDEMLEFLTAKDTRVKCYAVSFVEQACRKDIDVMKRAIGSLTVQFSQDYKDDVRVTKRIITTIANLYPFILKWIANNPRDTEASTCWEAFCILKERIMQKLDTDNEGVRTMTMKFLESVILSQSTKTEQSETGRGNIMCLNDIPKDHRHLSFRKLQGEATHNLQSLLDQAALQHITAQNLMVVITIICTIARQRPEFINIVLESLEALNGNLPPTLGTSQVKSVRKDMKLHLLRLHKHPSVVGNKSFTNRIVTLLTDLGISANELNKNLVGLRRRRGDEAGPSSKRSKTEEKMKEEDDDDDDEYMVEKIKPDDAVGDQAKQSAIDITAQFIYEKLTDKVAVNLVIISLMTLPEEMPPAFASSYTPIAAAGTPGQKQHLARVMAIQATAQDLGPGVEQMKKEKLQKLNERRKEGQLIPPTPMIVPSTSPEVAKHELKPSVISVVPKVKQHFDIVKVTKQLSKEEANELFSIAYKRVMEAERRATQGGAQQIHNIVLIRLTTRYHQEGNKYAKLLTEFIAQDHRQRTDLALLWIAELYAQYQGFSHFYNYADEQGVSRKEDRLDNYNSVMCGLLEYLYKKGLHKEVLFYKIILDSPLVTAQALEWLKMACIDPTYGSFGMTAVRELIMTRNRQRKELLRLLFTFAFYYSDQPTQIGDQSTGFLKLRELCLNNVKEFCEVSFLEQDLRTELVDLIERCVDPNPPKWFLPLHEDGTYEWTETCIRNALAVYLAVLPIDPTLLYPLAVTYAKSTKLFKKEVIQCIEPSLRAIGMHNEHVLKLIEDCPQGAETLLARVVYVVTERESATKELVTRFKKLFYERQIDVRSLIPILNSMEKEDVIKLLPKFVLSISTSKIISAVHKKLMSGKNGEDPLFSPTDLLYQYHQIIPSNDEESDRLVANLKFLLDSLTKDAIAAALERLLDVDPPPILFYSTLVIVYRKCPSLDGFLSNVIFKLVSRKTWIGDLENKKAMFQALQDLRAAGYAAILTSFNLKEFNEYMEFHGTELSSVFRKQMLDFLPSLSNQQLKSIDKEVLDFVDDPKERERREKAKEKRDKERKKDREKENEKDEDRKRDREKKERSRRDR